MKPMGGNERDESSFMLPKGRTMGEQEMQIELARIKERLANARKDIDCHDKQMEDQEKRISSLEKKLIFVSGVAAGGGSLAGAGLAKLFSLLGSG